MCGLAGMVCRDGADLAILERMAASLRHRGPDGEGVWSQGQVGLAHRRLAVLDLTPAAAQPMANEDGAVRLVYNGEIYNFPELRASLEARGHVFRSRSDGEVAVHGFEEWGEGCLERLNGHFALALWNGRTLFLARDRYGVKPLYYRWDGRTLLFASEVKALLCHPEVRAEVCYAALDEYFTFQNVLSDETLFRGIRLLPPGHVLTFESEPRVRRYWDYRFTPEDIPRSEAVEAVRAALERAVERQVVSDVPLACYLSGGVDSASVTALASRRLGRLHTFTCGFDLSSASGLELGCDERVHAEALSNVLKSEHYEVVLHAGDMEHVMPELLWHLEEPRVGQCYPNYYLARLAGKFVKVVLSGIGGDELFAGYPWRYYRGGAGDFHQSYYDFWQRLTPDADKPRLFQDQVLRGLGDRTSFDVFCGVLGDQPVATPEERVNASLYFELKTFLPGLLLVEDKLSMAHGLETRAPFLDNELVDLALRLPVSCKLENLTNLPVADEDEVARYQRSKQGGKTILREAMAGVIPAAFTTRGKQGFSAPDASWFRGESIDYLNALLRSPQARIREFLRPDYVAERLDQHCEGRQNHRLFIWSLLSLEWWLRTFL